MYALKSIGIESVNMKTVLTILPALPVGGAENMVYELIKNYDVRRFKAIVLCYGEKTNSYLEKQIENICRVVYVGLKGKLKVASFGRVFREIRKIKPDILHAHMGGAAFAILWSLFNPVRVVITVHTTPQNAFSPRIERLIRFGIKKKKIRLVTVSKENYKKAKEYYRVKNNLYEINNGIDIDGYYKSEHDKFTFINVARQDANKNQRAIIECFEKIVKKHPNTKLFLIGDGPLHSELVELVSTLKLESYVEMPGMIDRTKEFYAQADVYVQASHREALPLSVLEAMAARLPIIGTDVGGMNDLISNNGYLIEDNKESLLSAMSQMLYNSKIEMEQMGLNSRKKVLSYTSSQMADRYMEIYDSL